MMNFDPHKPFYRALFSVFGLVIISAGVVSLRHGDSSYQNWWGGVVFAPLGIILGVLFILGAIFKPGIFRK
jgi:uncharacterized membrane protein HdeD (DUF308 family)